MPPRRPETTIERLVARRCGGARSPTSGSMSCGVTVVTAVKKEMATKLSKDFVRQRPSHCYSISDKISTR
jgi:hypothetical protein